MIQPERHDPSAAEPEPESGPAQNQSLPDRLRRLSVALDAIGDSALSVSLDLASCQRELLRLRLDTEPAPALPPLLCPNCDSSAVGWLDFPRTWKCKACFIIGPACTLADLVAGPMGESAPPAPRPVRDGSWAKVTP